MSKFSEKYLRDGMNVNACERDGISKFQAFIEINKLTDKGVSVDERREIVDKFINRRE